MILQSARGRKFMLANASAAPNLQRTKNSTALNIQYFLNYKHQSSLSYSARHQTLGKKPSKPLNLVQKQTSVSVCEGYSIFPSIFFK